MQPFPDVFPNGKKEAKVLMTEDVKEYLRPKLTAVAVLGVWGFIKIAISCLWGFDLEKYKGNKRGPSQ